MSRSQQRAPAARSSVTYPSKPRERQRPARRDTAFEASRRPFLPASPSRPIILPFQARGFRMIVLRPVAAGMPCTTLWLRPNRALSRRGLGRLIMVLTALALMTAGLGAWQGNVFAPLFALVESVAMALALRTAWRAGDRSERIILGTASVEVRVMPGRRRVCFQPYWVRVRLAPGQGHDRLLLRSHGREIEIGAFLGDGERAELSRKLVALLADLNGCERR